IRVYPSDSEPEFVHAVSSSIRWEDQPIADLDSDAREALLLPWALAANQEVWQTNYMKASGIYREITDFFLDDLYVPTLYSCATYSLLFDIWGQVSNLTGEFQETIRFLPRAKALNPDFFSLALVEALSQTGNWFLALDELDNYLTLYPQHATAHMEKGIVLLNIGHYKNAVGELEEAVRIDSANPDSRYFLGVAFLGIGNVEDAIEQFNTTIELDPTHEGAKEQLNQLKQPET
ncbi:MAG: tetratricopeptide repeat protein, partial [Actinobacteria bacterium]|nr:tetratricopeptide repeat protein [Actinomycetota bacterium]